jgi:hypothetical protein
MCYIHSVYYTRLMKYLFILTITAIGYAVSAQEVSMYADQFRFNGNPKQVKLYYLSEGENGKPHWYWIIDYDYDKHVRTITRYREKDRKSTIYTADEQPLTHSLLPENDTISTFTGHVYQYNHSVVKKQVVILPDSNVIIITDGERPNGYRKLLRDISGRISERLYYYKDTIRMRSVYTYHDHESIIKEDNYNEQGELVNTTTITYDMYGNPVHTESYNVEDGDMAVINTEYVYDKHHNFTRSTETWNGKMNRIVVREITY